MTVRITSKSSLCENKQDADACVVLVCDSCTCWVKEEVEERCWR